MPNPKRVTRGPSPKPVIGWREWVRFPDLGVGQMKAKLDTGTCTASLHAFDLRETAREGAPFIRFLIHSEQGSCEPTSPSELPLVSRRPVRDSGGKRV